MLKNRQLKRNYDVMLQLNETQWSYVNKRFMILDGLYDTITTLIQKRYQTICRTHAYHQGDMSLSSECLRRRSLIVE